MFISPRFHAICLDTYPPCVYMNDVSHTIVNFVHAFNQIEGETKVCYTFDAGPNACLYLLEKNVKRVLSFINYVFPNDKQMSDEYVRGIPVDRDVEVRKFSIELKLNDNDLILGPGGVQKGDAFRKQCSQIPHPYKGWRWPFKSRMRFTFGRR